MTPQQIRDAIAASPALQAHQAAGRINAIAAALSAAQPKKMVAGTITTRGAAAAFPDLTGLGRALSFEVALSALETWRDANLTSATLPFKMLARAIKRQLESFDARGLDFSDAELRGMLDNLVKAPFGVLSQAQADGFKSLAFTVDDPITDAQVEDAIKGA